MGEALEVAPGKELDLDLWIPLVELADLAVLTGDERLLHHRHLEVEVLLGKVEVRREGLENAALLVGFEHERAWLVLPRDSVEVEEFRALHLGWIGERGTILRICLEIRRFYGHPKLRVAVAPDGPDYT